MCLDLCAQFPRFILQFPASPSKGVIDSEEDVGMAGIGGRCRTDIDVTAVRKAQTYADMVQTALTVMISWRLHAHMAARNPLIKLSKCIDVLLDPILERFAWISAVKIDSKLCLHRTLLVTKLHTRFGRELA